MGLSRRLIYDQSRAKKACREPLVGIGVAGAEQIKPAVDVKKVPTRIPLSQVLHQPGVRMDRTWLEGLIVEFASFRFLYQNVGLMKH